jgi:NAD-dependent dihydropyrimidine dehydrogenase PreA subunit
MASISGGNSDWRFLSFLKIFFWVIKHASHRVMDPLVHHPDQPVGHRRAWGRGRPIPVHTRSCPAFISCINRCPTPRWLSCVPRFHPARSRAQLTFTGLLSYFTFWVINFRYGAQSFFIFLQSFYYNTKSFCDFFSYFVTFVSHSYDFVQSFLAFCHSAQSFFEICSFILCILP